MAWTKRPYDGVRFRRAIVLRLPYFVDLFSVAAPNPRQFDWIYHNSGTFRVPGAPTLGDRGTGMPPHPDLTAWARLRGARAVEWTGRDEAGLTVFLGDADIAELYSADGPSNPVSESRTAIIRRLHGDRGLFAALFWPWRGSCSVHDIHLESSTENGVTRLTVELDDRVDTWEFGSLDSRAALEVSLSRDQ